MTQLAEFYDTDIATQTATIDAKAIFEPWATIEAGKLPTDPIDAMQVRLMRWQVERFGVQSDERLALGVVEECTENDLASEISEALDALGDVCVYACQLAKNNRLGFRAILGLAEAFHCQPPDEETIRRLVTSPGALAQVVLKAAQKVRGMDNREAYQRRLVGTLAACIARVALAIDVQIAMSESEHKPVDIQAVFLTVADSVTKRGAGHDAVPKVG